MQLLIIIVKGVAMVLLSDLSSIFKIVSTPVFDFCFIQSIICITELFVIECEIPLLLTYCADSWCSDHLFIGEMKQSLNASENILRIEITASFDN